MTGPINNHSNNQPIHQSKPPITEELIALIATSDTADEVAATITPARYRGGIDKTMGKRVVAHDRSTKMSDAGRIFKRTVEALPANQLKHLKHVGTSNAGRR